MRRNFQQICALIIITEANHNAPQTKRADHLARSFRSPYTSKCGASLNFGQYLVRLSVDTFPKDVMRNPSEPRVRRSQRDYRWPFTLAVVGEVGRSELSDKQAQRRYGIQGRGTVLTWCRRYASHFGPFQAAGPTSPGGAPAVDPTPEQRVKQLKTQLREQNRLAVKELNDA